MEENQPPPPNKVAPHPRDFFLAIRHWDANEVRRLLAEGADPNWETRGNDETALAFAARVSTVEVVKVLLEHGATDHGKIPLTNVVFEDDGTGGNPDTAAIPRLLLQYGADVNQTDETGMTPLMEAVVARDLATIELYLDHGADVDAVMPPNNPDRCLAISQDYPEFIELLQKFRAQNR